MLEFVAVAAADSSKLVAFVMDATVAPAMPVPLIEQPVTSAVVLSMVAVVLPLVVSTVLSVKFPLPVSELLAKTGLHRYPPPCPPYGP